jgi:small basic protein (TIGR04137 family)
LGKKNAERQGWRQADAAWKVFNMTIDKSLKIRRGLIRTRNVLTRAERIAKLAETDCWQEGDTPFGLAKVRVQKMVIKKKKKKKEEEEVGEGTESSETSATSS